MKFKQTNKKPVLYRMEEISSESEDDENKYFENGKEIETDNEIEEEMDEFLSHSEKEWSELSEIPEDIHDEEENEIPEYIECAES